jgi:hypothetical protein
MSAKQLPIGFLSQELINNRTSLYKMRNQPVLTPEFNVPLIEPEKETRWVWYAKEQVQTWLNEIEHYNGDGIRIYFGRKGDEPNPVDPFHAFPPEPGQLCLIMMITQAGSEKDSHINVVYERQPDYNQRCLATPGFENSESRPRGINAGSYCPPMTIVEGPDFPDNSLI